MLSPKHQLRPKLFSHFLLYIPLLIYTVALLSPLAFTSIVGYFYVRKVDNRHRSTRRRRHQRDLLLRRGQALRPGGANVRPLRAGHGRCIPAGHTGPPGKLSLGNSFKARIPLA